MIKTEIICVGKIKEEFYREAVAEYSKRLSRFTKLEIKELPEGKNPEAEEASILRASTGYKIALCIEGEKLSSECFAEKIKKLCDSGQTISLIIGSSCGLSQGVKKASDYKLSFSDMTFPHQLMRVILCEQLYRAFMINGGGLYHK